MDSDVENALLNDDYDLNELCKSENFEFTRLSDVVRKHYVQYLEKQLNENLLKWQQYHKNMIRLDCYMEPIQRTVKILEDRAVKICMLAQLYQRAMIKIISCVKQKTQEKRLVKTLEEIINGTERMVQNRKHKAVQTELHDLKTVESQQQNHFTEMFHHHSTKIENVLPNNELKHSIEYEDEKNKQFNYGDTNDGNEDSENETFKRKRLKESDKICDNSGPIIASTSVCALTPMQSPTLLSTEEENQNKLSTVMVTLNEVDDINDIRDDVALELARMFSEEKTELDEIFGIDPNDEPDDPQICSILKEIQNAKINVDDKRSQKSQNVMQSEDDITMQISSIELTKVTSSSSSSPAPISNRTVYVHANKGSSKLKNHHQHEQHQPLHHPYNLHYTHQRNPDNKIVDLNKSLWPCELFMQKRKLSESLTRLVDEDYRWVDIMKWKFSQLFGEDSDDEFAACSPSIELNMILINSCVRRISPWVVKYLMKPMKEGLIGNRYLFKRLAKQLARSIIMENQYPNESIVKYWVENVFCLHRAILSVDDLNSLPLQLSSLDY